MTTVQESTERIPFWASYENFNLVFSYLLDKEKKELTVIFSCEGKEICRETVDSPGKFNDLEGYLSDFTDAFECLCDEISEEFGELFL
jgi:hypothetical protein